MTERGWRLAAGIVASVLLGVCACTPGPGNGTAGSGPAPPPPTASSRARPPCQPAALALGYGPQLSPMTGEHGDFYALVNRGASVCTLAGYPGITLYDANGAPLPFHYTRKHSPYVTAAPPVTVTLRPGASAWLLVAKYRCDTGIGRNATTIRITVPGAQYAVVTGRVSASGAGVSALSYCLGGVNDPGQTVAVSPIEPALQATGRR